MNPMKYIISFIGAVSLFLIPYVVRAIEPVATDLIFEDPRTATSTTVVDYGNFNPSQLAWPLTLSEENRVLCGVQLRMAAGSHGGGNPEIQGAIWTGATKPEILRQFTFPNTSTFVYDLPLYPASSTVTWVLPTCAILQADITYWLVLQFEPGSWGAAYYRVYVNFDSVDQSEPILWIKDGDWIPAELFGGDGYIPISPESRWIGFINGSNVEQPDSVNYDFTAGAASGTDFGTFGNLFRDLFIWLFIPSEKVLTGIDNYKADVQTRIPFGWFAYASSSLSGLGDENTTSTQIILYASSTTSTLSAVVFDPLLIESTIPSGILSSIRFLGGMILWAFLFVYFFRLATGNHANEEDHDI